MADNRRDDHAGGDRMSDFLTNTSSRFNGLCIGGPWAGQRTHAQYSVIRVPMMRHKVFVLNDHEDLPDKFEVEYHFYFWVRADARSGHWHWDYRPEET